MKKSKAEMLEDLYNNDVKEWMKTCKHNAKFAAITLSLYELDENRKLSDKEVEKKWKSIGKKASPYGKKPL